MEIALYIVIGLFTGFIIVSLLKFFDKVIDRLDKIIELLQKH
jgi:flagellar biosynthesis protein FliQ